MTSRAMPTSSQRRFLGTIARRITWRMLLVAAVPVLAVSALTIGSLLALADRADDRLAAGRAELTGETVGAQRAEQASSVVAEIDEFVAERLGDVIDWSEAGPILSAALAEHPDQAVIADLTPAEIESSYDPSHRLEGSRASTRWLRRRLADQPAFTQAVLTDADGYTIGSAEDATAFANGDAPWWTEAWAEGIHVGPIAVDEGGGSARFDLAVRVDDPASGRGIGVLRVVADSASLHRFADAVADEQRGIEARIFSSDGLLIAETATGHDPTRIPSVLVADDERSTAYRNALEGTEPSGLVMTGDTVGGFGRTSGDGGGDPTLGVVTVVEQPTTQALAPLDDLQSLGSDLKTTSRFLVLVVAGLVLITLILAWWLARLLARGIAKPINILRVEANRLAERELPELVNSLRAPDVTGEIPVVRPIEVDADGEVAELAAAFNSVRSTAVELAAEQAIGRTRDVSSILLNLGRRNQQLVGRQLRYIDELERNESDPDALRSLFTLDQMATRMRRNAESLLVLAGEDSPRRGGRPRGVEEIVRAATSEVEDYFRVRLSHTEPAQIQPPVINDVTHLLAELIENATNFSPPDETIEITGAHQPDGSYAISIVDRGVGIPPLKLQEANARLRERVFTGETSSSFLGLFVVGRLAARHGIDAELFDTPGQPGITARVTLPPGCLLPAQSPVPEVAGSRLAATDPGADVPVSWPPPSVNPRPPAPSHSAPPPEVVAAPPPIETAPPPIETAPVIAPQTPEPEPEPAPVPSVAEGGDPDPSDDETAGLPIPPFRARQPKRPDEASTGDRFQVRRRVRRHRSDGPLETVAANGGGRQSAQDRASEVREKLNRFANGVRAAKTGSSTPPDHDDEARTSSRGTNGSGLDEE